MKKVEVKLRAAKRAKMAAEGAKASSEKALSQVTTTQDEAVARASSIKAKLGLILV